MLWPSKEDTQPNNNLEEEEAPTDIEEPDGGHSLQQNGKAKHTQEISSETHSIHKTHNTDQNISSSVHPNNRNPIHLRNEAVSNSSSTTTRQSKRIERFSTFEDESSAKDLVYKASPFSSWTRTKAGQSSTSKTKGTKRDVDVTDPASNSVDAKRARSGLDDAAL